MEPESPRRPAAGDPAQNAELFATLYRELRAIADRQLRRDVSSPLSPTTVLHEAYLNIAERDKRFQSEGHFIGYAVRVMRGLIIDRARERRALKRGAGFHLTELPTEPGTPVTEDRELAQVSDAIDELASHDAGLAELVDLKYFCGYTFQEIATLQGKSERTVQRDWEKARRLLYQQLQSE